MDDFFKSLKNRFSIENVISFMKEAKLVEDEKAEEISNPIVENTANENINSFVNVEEAHNTVTIVESKPKIENDREMPVVMNELLLSKTSPNISNIPDKMNVLQKPSSHDVNVELQPSDPKPESSNTDTPEERIKKTTEIALFF